VSSSGPLNSEVNLPDSASPSTGVCSSESADRKHLSMPSSAAPLQNASPGELDPAYFDGTEPWSARLKKILARDSFRAPFKRANADLTPQLLKAEQPGLRAVINMGAGIAAPEAMSSLLERMSDDVPCCFPHGATVAPLA
jgi:hypothetical protein